VEGSFVNGSSLINGLKIISTLNINYWRCSDDARFEKHLPLIKKILKKEK
jgi:hypothetical protein